MPYTGKAERILSGSVNLIQPGSEIPDHDAQKIENFTYDAHGNLRSRKGSTNICAASNVSDLLKTLSARWQAVNTARIIGWQKYLWKVGTGTVLKDCATIISATGPRKSTGANDLSWAIAAPATAPTAKAAATVTTLIDDFSAGWVVDPPGDDDVLDDPHVLQIASSGDETYSATKTKVIDLGTDQSIDDIHKITFWAKQWKKIEGVTIELDVNLGDFTTDVYTTKMQLVNKIIGKKDEAVFYLRKRPFGVDKASVDKKQYGHFNRIGSTPDKDWRTVGTLRIKVDFSSTTKFRFMKWELIGDEDNTLEGDDFQVFYTYVNADGHESNPSPPSEPITVNRSGIQVTGIVESADPQVVKKHIYLTGGTLGGIWRVNGSTDPENALGITGPTYNITQSEDDILALGIEMENDNDAPPNAKVIAGPYYDRILLAQTTDRPERIFWSKQAKPYAFPGATEAIGNHNDIGTAGEKIMALTIRPHNVFIYKENAVWVLKGDPGDLTGDFHETSAQMGISSPAGVVKAGAVDYAHMSEGIYAFNGGIPQKVSQRIDPIFKGRTVTLSDGTTAQPISNVTTTALGYRDNVLWFSYQTAGGRRTVKLDIESGRWFSDTRGFTAFYYEGQGGTFLAGQDNGQVVSLEQGTTDNGASIPVDYLSKDYDLGSPDMDKKFEDFTIETLGSPLTLTAYLNGRMPDAETVSLGVTTGGRQVFKLAADSTGRRARTIALRAQGSVSSETVINKLIINYYDETREALSYDTEVTDANTHKVKLIRELKPSLEAEGLVTFTLYTDVPGFNLTLRESHTVLPSGRHTEPIVMESEIYAHDFQTVASSSSSLHLFNMHALVQVIGTYLHGSKGEYYSSDPLDFDTERVKMLKEIEVVYSSLGAVLLTLYSDLPGSVILSRGSVALPATQSTLSPVSAEQSIKIECGGLIKGRLFKLRLDPIADCRVEAIRFFVKQIGQPQATPWGWVDLPLEKTQDAIWVPLTFQKDRAA